MCTFPLECGRIILYDETSEDIMARQTARIKIRQELAKESKVKPIKPRKKRAPLSAEQKAVLVERMAKAREARGPAKNLSIDESIRDLPADNPLSPSKIKDYIKSQKELMQGLKSSKAKDSKDAGLRGQYWDTDTYLFNLQRYLNDGVYRDHRYGAEKQNKIKMRSVAMAYYPDGTPKRTVGVFYNDIGEVYTNEMYLEDNQNRN